MTHGCRAESAEAEDNPMGEKRSRQESTPEDDMCHTIQQLSLQLEVSKKEIEMLKSKLLNNNRSNTPTISEVVRPLPNNDAPEPPPRTRGRHAEATALNKSSCDRQVEAGRASIPTAKVQPQPSPTAQVQPRSTPTPKQTDSVANRERPGSPAQRTDPSPVKVRPDQGQTRNQSRRSRKNRARRH